MNIRVEDGITGSSVYTSERRKTAELYLTAKGGTIHLVGMTGDQLRVLAGKCYQAVQSMERAQAAAEQRRAEREARDAARRVACRAERI